MNPCLVKFIFRLVCGCLVLELLTGTTGCTSKPREPALAEVSGKVLFKGRPLPGGTVTFTAVKGGFPSAGQIDENGNYQINAPVGEVVIGVDNGDFRPRFEGGKGKSSPEVLPQERGRNKRPEFQEEAKPIKGRYVEIPERYADGSTSGLTYTVKPGPQTHDIELSDSVFAPPGAGGR
jgi:hypothetical protein